MNELELLNDTEEIIPENIITKEQFVKFVENSVKFEELMMMYRCAIREVQTKLEILNASVIRLTAYVQESNRL